MYRNCFDRAVVPAQAKWAFTTRRVIRSDITGLQSNVRNAVSGDLLLSQIVEIGQHKKIQLAEARYSESYLGDYVVAACGDRYAPDQFEAVATIDSCSADLVAGGGIVGKIRAAHDRMALPTKVRPLGLLTDSDGHVINLARYGLPVRRSNHGMTVIGVVGNSMNAGKTTAAASLAHGLSRSGCSVAALKATGTGAFGDFNAYRDAGADIVADFTDVGMASTYRQPIGRIEAGFDTLLSHASDKGAGIAIVELADGLFQRETAQILRSSRIRNQLSGMVFAAPDALSAIGGSARLLDLDLPLLVVSGKVSCSPLASVEASEHLSVPIASRENLRDPEFARGLLAKVADLSPQLIGVPTRQLKSAA